MAYLLFSKGNCDFFSYALTQFIFAPVLGGLSDRFGRRIVLLSSLFGLGVDYIFLALAPTIQFLFVGRIISGLTGASYTTAGAYIADVSPPEKRAQNFGLIGAAFGIGFIVGPVLGGIFSKFGLRVPFYVAAVLCLMNWTYGFFFLPESLSRENRRPFSLRRANPIGSFYRISKLPVPILGLMISLALIFLANHSSESTWTYITMEKFQWNEQIVGYSLGVVGLTMTLVQGFLLRLWIPKFGLQHAAIFGMIVRIVVSILFAFATSTWMMFALLVPFAVSFLAGSSVQGFISNHIPASEQGELQGMMSGITGITAIVGPLIMTGLFSFFTDRENPIYFPGAPFLLSAVLSVFAAILAYLCFRELERKASVGEDLRTKF
jgi:DHA1 family tetracycline resistance protein-like MFS transporter